MEHKKFIIASICVLCIVIPIVGVFDYVDSVDTHLTWRKLILKGIPLTLYIILSWIYFKVYRITNYLIFMQCTLYFCLLGDMFILFNSKLYFILSGIFFFISRILLLINFMIHPFSKIKLIKYKICKLLISHTCFTLPYLALGIISVVFYKNPLSYLILFYMFLGFGFQQSYAWLRINKLSDETFISTILAFVGISLFNISDLLLFFSIFGKFTPSYVKIISDDIYWLAIYLLTISLVRTSCVDTEKANYIRI